MEASTRDRGVARGVSRASHSTPTDSPLQSTQCVSTRVYASREDPLLRSQVRPWEPFCLLKVTPQLSLSTGPSKTARDHALQICPTHQPLRLRFEPFYLPPSAPAAPVVISVPHSSASSARQLPLPRLGCFPLQAWLTATCQVMPPSQGCPKSCYVSRPPVPVPRAPTTAVTERPLGLPLSFQWELLGGRDHVNFALPQSQHSARLMAGAQQLHSP